MGLFLKYKDYYKNETVVQSQPRTTVNNNGKQDYVAQTINTGVSIFGSLLSYTSDGKGGIDNQTTKGGKIDSETQKKIDAKEYELKNLYSTIDVKNEKDLYKKVKKQSDMVINLSNEVNSLSASLQIINQNLSSLNTQYSNVTTQINNLKKSESANANDTNYINQLNLLNNKLRELESKIKAANNELSTKTAQLEKKQNELNIKQTEFAKLAGVAAQAENLENEILQLKGKSLTHDVNYNVEQETKDLSRFNTALKSFPKTGATQDDADNLINAFNNSGSENKETAVNQKNAILAMKFIKQANPELDWSKLNIA